MGKRDFTDEELAHVGGRMGASNPSSLRFSPFAHNPRSCLGRNFAQMEMRLIMLYLFRDFSFTLAPAYQRLMNRVLGANPGANEFRGINRATMPHGSRAQHETFVGDAPPLRLETDSTASSEPTELNGIKKLCGPTGAVTSSASCGPTGAVTS